MDRRGLIRHVSLCLGRSASVPEDSEIDGGEDEVEEQDRIASMI